jgi:peptidoglycan-associated lipoprotein
MMKSVALRAVLVALVLAACAKQPTTTQSSAPSPTGAAGSGVAGAGGMRSAGATAGDMGRGTGTGSANRPSLQEFRPTANLADIHFDYDRADIREADARVLDANATWLKSNTDHLVVIEGHCDERGTNQYNTALGDRRARATLNYLVSHGVQASRVTVVSYGEERPACAQSGDECWAKNRRAHFLVKPR